MHMAYRSEFGLPLSKAVNDIMKDKPEFVIFLAKDRDADTYSSFTAFYDESIVTRLNDMNTMIIHLLLERAADLAKNLQNPELAELTQEALEDLSDIVKDGVIPDELKKNLDDEDDTSQDP